MAARFRKLAHVLETRCQCRYSTRWHLLAGPRVCSIIGNRSYGSDSKENGFPTDKKGKKEKDGSSKEDLSPKQIAALEKLNSLLTTMKVTRIGDERKKVVLDLAKPTQRIKEIEKRKMQEEERLKQEAAELESGAAAEKKDTFTPSIKDDLDPNLLHAVKDVAASLGGDVATIESELLSKLREHGKQEGSAEKMNLSDVVVGMKIERSKTDDGSRSYPVSSRMFQSGESGDQGTQGATRSGRISWARENRSTKPRSRTKIDLFGSGTLNIFSRSDYEVTDKPEFPQLKLWDRLEEKELQLQILHPPKNAYEEMIRWTEQNKLWKFPIDNEAGLEDEAEVSFHEHVFLDHLLEDGFPKKGPVRHFMELVITGLSKNPYLTVQQKHDHVAWFRDYFKDKEELLKAVGAA